MNGKVSRGGEFVEALTVWFDLDERSLKTSIYQEKGKRLEHDFRP